LKFIEFDFEPEVQEGIDSLGFENATEVQEKTIPAIMRGDDVIAAAQTGTGKTAAFLLPVMNAILTANSNNTDSVKALIIVPTRELAMQIDQQIEGLSYFTSISSIAVYGGTDRFVFDAEKKGLEKGADIIVCTPGRFIAHLNLEYVKIDGLTHLILDEADRMLDMGFVNDIKKIITYLPKKRQVLLFSATMPANVRTLARTIMNKPSEINIAISKTVDKVLQVAYIIYEEQKRALVKHIVSHQQLKRVIIFCATKKASKGLSSKLIADGFDAADIHSDLVQKEREVVLSKFKQNKLKILVATDVLSRGIDIENIDLVINYNVPKDKEDYIHRIGRTARADSEGIAITLVSQEEQNDFYAIEKFLETTVYKAPLPEGFDKGPEYNPRMISRRNNTKRPYKKRYNKKH